MKVINLLSCTTISIAILLLLAIFVTSFLFDKSSPIFAQNTTTTTITTTNITATNITATNTTTMIGSKIPYYIFPAELEGVEGHIANLSSDIFTVQTIIAKKGDTLTIKFYNTEALEPHTFTLDAPYNINSDIKGGENSTIKFVANNEGIFTYYCIYHQPTMTGKLVVLP
ncbi:MAG TPA: cupredoxin domain-containing protein [Nitrososphaeraceae archaeon]|jgi:plastocyanin|nr:cupredoxin domain-containing protein [Nitrososphaeraceae archaeon]